MHRDVKEILISEEEIEAKCKELGAVITQAYKDYEQPPVLVALLKGSVPFMASLIKHIDLDIEYDFMDVSSYEGTTSTRDIRILKDLDRSIKNVDILLVEDIVDTGHTIKETMRILKSKGAHECKIVTLLDKPSGRVTNLDVDWKCFDIPDEFVVGYGLDYRENYRNLPYIGILKPEIYY